MWKGGIDGKLFFYALLAFHSRFASVIAFRPLPFVAKKDPVLQHAGVHSGRAPQARSESHAEVHSECDSVRRRRVCRPIETDGQVCLDEVSFY
jgi:hypothetical protein